MKKLILFFGLLLCLSQVSAQQKVIYVKAGANGNGSSWAKAFGDLQAALLKAQSGQEIWVAAGTYYPTKDNDRNLTFSIKDNIRIYGGFSGKESRREDRDWYTHLTVLSGEIGTAETSDNSYTIIYTKNVSSNTLVDGFVITGAKSNGTNAMGNIERSGGGWYNDGVGGESSPTIANCLFIDNYAREGAGLFNNANGGICRPAVNNCQFISNMAHLEGAAIFNDGRNGQASPSIQRSYFLQNASNYGPVMRNLADGGQSIPTVSNSVFEANTAYAREIIYNCSDTNEHCKTILLDCRFFDNSVSMGSNGNNTPNPIKKQGYRNKGEIKYIRK